MTKPAGAPPGAGAVNPVPAAGKAHLRRSLRTARSQGPVPDRARASALAGAVLSNPQVATLLAPRAVVLGYVSLRYEPPTSVLRSRLTEAGVRVLLPVAQPDGHLDWVDDPGPDSGRAWGVGANALPEGTSLVTAAAPSARVVIVPALAATRDGRRLGQGGGYYDRLLAALPAFADGGPLRVALVGPDEVLADLPVEPHDARVDVVIAG